MIEKVDREIDELVDEKKKYENAIDLLNESKLKIKFDRLLINQMVKSIYIFENKNIRVNLYVNDEAYKNQVKKRYRTSNVVNIFVVATYLPFFYCFSKEVGQVVILLREDRLWGI